MIDYDQLVAATKKVPRDGRNYKDGNGFCYYTDSSGRNCLVGAILLKLDITLPPFDDPLNRASITALPAAAFFVRPLPDLLCNIQWLADRGTLTWGEVIDIVLSDYDAGAYL